jgi:hypothetical protein
MSKPSPKKRQKQQHRKRAACEKLHEYQEKLRRRDAFPRFEFSETNDAPAEFVSIVRRAVRGVDFARDSEFSDHLRGVLTAFRDAGERKNQDLILDVLESKGEQRELLSSIGQAVFNRIPEQDLLRFIPYCDVEFMLRGTIIDITFRSLSTRLVQGKPIYFAKHKPTILIDGANKIIAYSRHAIERICERRSPRWKTYWALGPTFELFAKCRHFETCRLSDGTLALSPFDKVPEEGVATAHYVPQVLEQPRDPAQDYYYRLGYCPIEFRDDFAVASTLLMPGYAHTPEYQALCQAPLPQAQKQKLLAQYGSLHDNDIRVDGQWHLIKFLHDLGIPQVVAHARPKIIPATTSKDDG